MDHITGTLLLIPFIRAAKDTDWLAARETKVGERENEIRPCPKGVCVREPCVGEPCVRVPGVDELCARGPGVGGACVTGLCAVGI